MGYFFSQPLLIERTEWAILQENLTASRRSYSGTRPRRRGRACPLGTCPLPSRIQVNSNYSLLTDRYMCAVL